MRLKPWNISTPNTAASASAPVAGPSSPEIASVVPRFVNPRAPTACKVADCRDIQGPLTHRVGQRRIGSVGGGVPSPEPEDQLNPPSTFRTNRLETQPRPLGQLQVQDSGAHLHDATPTRSPLRLKHAHCRGRTMKPLVMSWEQAPPPCRRRCLA